MSRVAGWVNAVALTTVFVAAVVAVSITGVDVSVRQMNNWSYQGWSVVNTR